MDRRIIPLLIVLVCSLCCLSLVSADNNTTDNLTIAENEELGDYIIPVTFSANGIEFSDGFTGFCIDSKKATITVNDQFTSEKTKTDALENHIKLAIIESYKAGKEDNIGDIVSQVINGNEEYDIVQAVFNSTETIDDTATVTINNNTEATFTFELLKSVDGSKSDCLAYKVSFKKIENSPTLGASNNETNATPETASENNDSNNAITATGNNNTPTKQADNNKSNGEQTIINETNNTVINKTNTVVVNENNTTIINKNNTKVINKTDENPQNATIQNKILRTVGNPIFLLVIVIIIIAIAAVAIRRKN